MTPQELVKLKDKYWTIYKSVISGQEFIWRELSRNEYNKAVRYFPNSYEREEYVCNLCVIKPKNYDFNSCLAGIPSTLVVQILQESGFSQEPTGKINSMIEHYIEEMSNFQHQISCIICEAFPSLNIEEVENWQLEKTIWYFSRAKYIIEKLRGISLMQENQEQQEGIIVTKGSHSDFPELRQQKAFMRGEKVF